MTTRQQDPSGAGRAGPGGQDWQQQYPPHYGEQHQGQVPQQAYGGQNPGSQAYGGPGYGGQQQDVHGGRQPYARPPYPEEDSGAEYAEYYVPHYTVLESEPEPDPEPDPGYVLPEVPVSAWSVDNSRSAWISRGVLVLILLVQVGLSYRLDGSAFAQEAKFLTADGRLSGPIAGLGLAGARTLSLAWALGATALLFGATRLLFNVRAGLAAAA
ncbi:hypothetical protein AB0D38_29900, partial [Streptomyces sp. NPDC048279]